VEENADSDLADERASHVPADAGASPDGFDGLELDSRLLRTIASLGYEEPTPIQREAIPPLLAGRDLLAEAPTGTGKTAAFALPTLQRIEVGSARDGSTSALILVPTRELAMQVAEAISKYGRELGARVLPVYGGQPISQQLRGLRRGLDVVVATPGRAVDHLKRGSLSLDDVAVVVLDEADEMLDMGFAEDLETILAATPSTRQTALFSATISQTIARIAKRHLNDPVRVKVHGDATSGDGAARVRQVAYVVRRTDKLAALCRILDVEDPTSALVFGRTRGEVDDLAEALSARGHDAGALHGGLSQEARDRMMARFRDGTLDVLVATDVAARGLDIEHVSHVVNFDVPSNPDAYIHRIGRTGRAGREGVAITLVEPREHRLLRNIEAATRLKLEIARIPTVADLRERRTEVLRGNLREALLEDGFDRFRGVVEPLTDEFDLMDIALAAVSLIEGAGGAEADEVELSSPPLFAPPPSRPARAGAQPGRRPSGRDERPGSNWRAGPDQGSGSGQGPGSGQRPTPSRRPSAGYGPSPGYSPRPGSRRVGAPVDGPRGGFGPDDGRGTSVDRPGSSGPWVRLFVGGGRRAGIRPGDLVGAITNEAGVPGSVVGAIQINDGFSLVDIQEPVADDVGRALAAATIRGRRLKVHRES
jgi:ATP-dependent RNA helicase DeaD